MRVAGAGALLLDALTVADGPNADRYAGDRAIATRTAGATDPLHLRLAPGGGFVARLRAR